MTPNTYTGCCYSLALSGAFILAVFAVYAGIGEILKGFLLFALIVSVGFFFGLAAGTNYGRTLPKDNP